MIVLSHTVETEQCEHDYVVKHLSFCTCEMCARGERQKESGVESSAKEPMPCLMAE